MTDQEVPNFGQMHIIVGKIASGKSTLAKQLAVSESAILISEDEWLAKLFKDDLKTLEDYVTCTRKLRSAMAPLLIDVLKSGQSLVLDFAANTKGQRAWMASIIEQAQCEHSMHCLEVGDEICLERLRIRNASSDHAFETSEVQFHQFNAYFDAPSEAEGFSIIRYDTTASSPD